MQGKARAGRDLRDAGDITGSCSPAVLPRTCSRRRRGGRRCRRTWPAACWYSRSCTGCRTGRPRTLCALTSPVEGGVRPVAAGDVVRPDRAGALTQAHREVRAAGPGVRRGRRGDSGDGDLAGPAQAVRGLDGVRRRGGYLTQDTVTQLVAAMRRVARVVPGAAQVIAVACVLEYSRPGKPPIDWDDPQAREALVSDLVNDALAELTGQDAPERDAAEADALGLLALVAGQDAGPAEDSDGTDGRWRIARKVAPGRVISTVDREARHTRKCKSKRRDGFRGARGRRAGHRADHRLRDDDGRRAGQHRRGERREDGRARPVPRRPAGSRRRRSGAAAGRGSAAWRRRTCGPGAGCRGRGRGRGPGER